MAEYLEREELLRELRLWHMHRSDEMPDHFHYTGIKAWIEALPAEDVQPVKHGRWSGDFCSNCGISKYNFISFNIVGEKEYARPFGTWKYCPNCGARMEDGK